MTQDTGGIGDSSIKPPDMIKPPNLLADKKGESKIEDNANIKPMGKLNAVVNKHANKKDRKKIINFLMKISMLMMLREVEQSAKRAKQAAKNMRDSQ